MMESQVITGDARLPNPGMPPPTLDDKPYWHNFVEPSRSRQEALERVWPDGRRLIDHTIAELRKLPRERQAEIAKALSVTVEDLLSKWARGRGVAKGTARVRPKYSSEWRLRSFGVEPFDTTDEDDPERPWEMFRCLRCGMFWPREYQRPGVLRQDYWRCPSGCNGPGRERVP